MAADDYVRCKPIADICTTILACGKLSLCDRKPRLTLLQPVCVSEGVAYGDRELFSSPVPRYNEAAEAYEEGLKTSPGDVALGRGLEDVLNAQSAAKATAGKFYVLSTCPLLIAMCAMHSTVDNVLCRQWLALCDLYLVVLSCLEVLLKEPMIWLA